MGPVRKIVLSRAATALAALAMHASDGHAQLADESPTFSFSGFGTLGVAHSNLRGAEFSSTPVKPRGAGGDQPWSAAVDSLLAVQASANVAPRFTGLLQVVSEQNYDGSFRPHVEWASLKYQLTPDASVRVGRTVLQTLLETDTRKVGYTRAWVRPPVEVYSLVPVTHSDGVDATYRTAIGPLVASTTVTVGRSRVDSAGPDNLPPTRAEARGLATVGISLEYGDALLSLNHGGARVSIPAIGALFAEFRQFGPAGAAIAGRYDPQDVPVRFLSLGAEYDPGRWFVVAEWSRFRGGPLLGLKSAWYAGGGYRAGKFTPYATYAHAKADAFSEAGLGVAGLSPAQAQFALILNANLDAILRRKVAQETVAVGLRWDVSKNASLKVQYDHTRVGAGSNGSVVNLQRGFRTGQRFGVLSANFDFIF